MTEFEYFSAMIAVILALGVTHILGQISYVTQNPRKAGVYWVHSVWVGVTLLAHFSAWWNIWGLKASIDFSYLTFLYMLIGPTALFLAARAILPRIRQSASVYLERHYYSVHRAFFIPLAVFVIWPSFLGLIVLDTASIAGILEHAVFLAPMVACAISRNRYLHAASAILVAAAFLLVSFSAGL